MEEYEKHFLWGPGGLVLRVRDKAFVIVGVSRLWFPKT